MAKRKIFLGILISTAFVLFLMLGFLFGNSKGQAAESCMQISLAQGPCPGGLTSVSQVTSSAFGDMVSLCMQ